MNGAMSEVVTKRRRSRWVVALITLLAAGIPMAVAFTILHKQVDDRWERCGIDDRDVRSIAVGPDGWVHAAVNGLATGDVWSSSDQCTTFAPKGLQTASVWNLSWLPKARFLCAGTRDGLYCGDPNPHIPFGKVRARTETYFTIETASHVVAGGWPLLLAGPDIAQLQPVVRLSYAAASASFSDGMLFVAGDNLRVSRDDGRSFQALSQAPLRARAVAAKAGRVYAGGGFGGAFLSRSDDLGLHFRAATLPGSQPEILVLPAADPNLVLLGTHGDVRRGDLYLSRDGGETWKALGCPGAEIHAAAVDERYLYCGATALLGKRGMWRILRSDVGL